MKVSELQDAATALRRIAEIDGMIRWADRQELWFVHGPNRATPTPDALEAEDDAALARALRATVMRFLLAKRLALVDKLVAIGVDREDFEFDHGMPTDRDAAYGIVRATPGPWDSDRGFRDSGTPGNHTTVADDYITITLGDAVDADGTDNFDHDRHGWIEVHGVNQEDNAAAICAWREAMTEEKP